MSITKANKCTFNAMCLKGTLPSVHLCNRFDSMMIVHMHTEGGRGLTALQAQLAGVGDVHVARLQVLPHVVALLKGLRTYCTLPDKSTSV